MTELSHIYFEGHEPSRVTAEKEYGAGDSVRLRVPIASKRQTEGVTLSGLAECVLEESGLDPEGYRASALNRRVPACLRSLRLTSEEAALALLKRKPELRRTALGALLIGVSEFWRDAQVFAQLREELSSGLNFPGPANVYSAGCSAGQELFSVGMMLDELGMLDGCRLLGMDCRAEAIEQARAGVFELRELQGLDQVQRERYFEPTGSRVRISPRLLNRMQWRVGDVGRSPPAGPWDLILFRNVAIYLEAEYAREVWEALVTQLTPGGLLVTGKAERPPGNLGLRRMAPCIYRKCDC